MNSRALTRLAALYLQMDEAYHQAAQLVGLSCDGCTDNCCTSYFQHHTYIEWAYLWQGIDQLPEALRQRVLGRARRAVAEAQNALAQGQRPEVMCPLNEEGRCTLYAHRLMICRLHGVPNRLRRPDGRVFTFPGCWKSQARWAEAPNVPVLDRTPFYLQLVELEQAFVGSERYRLPKVDLTLAEMLVAGPPFQEATHDR